MHETPESVSNGETGRTDLNRNSASDLWVFDFEPNPERTVHDVAPVAGRISDTQEDRHITTFRIGKRLIAPFEPVDGIVGVLLEVCLLYTSPSPRDRQKSR